jgi:CysZ protein
MTKPTSATETADESSIKDRTPGSPPSGLPGLARGMRLLFEGLRLLVATRSLWVLAAIPVTICVLALTLAGWGLFGNAALIHETITSWLPAYEVVNWYQWLWLGPTKLFFKLTGYLLFALACGFALIIALLISNILSAPFLDALSQKVERIVTGDVAGSGDSGLSAIAREARRTISNEVQRLLFFIAIWGVVSLGGVLIPGGQLIAPPILMLFTAIFLPLDYAGHVLDRKQISFARRRNWVSQNFSTMLGFGSMALAISLVPGLNLLLLPTMVVAGTLLALRVPLEG